MPPARSKKKHRCPPGRVEDVITLRQRLDAGQAAEADTREYRRLISVFRHKYRGGALSLESAQRLGIE
jgi:hypothetical protein